MSPCPTEELFRPGLFILTTKCNSGVTVSQRKYLTNRPCHWLSTNEISRDHIRDCVTNRRYQYLLALCHIVYQMLSEPLRPGLDKSYSMVCMGNRKMPHRFLALVEDSMI